MSFFEIRQYEIRPGKMASWLKMFDEEIVPFQTGKGMVIHGVFSGEDDDSVFFWIRRFEDEAHRERLYAAVYDSDEWKTGFADRVGEHIDRSKIKVSRVVASAMSVMK